MADKPENVIIHSPSHALQEKIGNANLDQLLSVEVVESAQEVIHQSSDQFLEESQKLLVNLEELQAALHKNPGDMDGIIAVIAGTAFSLKTKAGLGGYDLVFDLGKSLQLHCEKLATHKPTLKDIELIRWHIASIGELLRARVKGKGGAGGEAILAELQRLSSYYGR